MLEPLFAGGDLDRATHLRARAGSLWTDPRARAAALWRGKPLFDLAPGPRLAWLPSRDPTLEGAPEEPVFLGAVDGAPRFALDVSHLGPPDEGSQPTFLDRTTYDLSETRKFIELRAVMADLGAADAGDAATAKGVLEWHRSHPRCARCGAATAPADAGWRRHCGPCGANHFPRTDPVAIMLVLDGDRALLGRQASWPEDMYSLIAGFMEPGETIEETVRRETLEEAGLPIGRVRYICSQPWPFPSSLMIGCAAEALSAEIRRADAELQDAIWADRAEVGGALAGRPTRFSAAREGAVARNILRAWAAGDIDGFA